MKSVNQLPDHSLWEWFNFFLSIAFFIKFFERLIQI